MELFAALFTGTGLTDCLEGTTEATEVHEEFEFFKSPWGDNLESDFCCKDSAAATITADCAGWLMFVV